MGRGMGPSFTNASSFYVVPGPSLFCPIDRPVPNLVASRQPLSQGLYFSPRYMHKHEILGEHALAFSHTSFGGISNEPLKSVHSAQICCRLCGKKEEDVMSEQELRDILVALLTGEPASLGERGEQDEPLIEAIATFEEAGLGDGGTGLVITTGDGVEFRVSIVRNS